MGQEVWTTVGSKRVTFTIKKSDTKFASIANCENCDPSRHRTEIPEK